MRRVTFGGMSRRFWPILASLASTLSLGSTGLGSEGSEAATRDMTREEIEAWLDASAVNSERDIGVSEAVPEAPPPPPHAHGLVVESSVGGAGHLGALKNVSPTAPEFGLILGYEVVDPLLLFADLGMFIASTRYAKRPPDPRTYAYYSFGGGARFTLGVSETIGLFLQGNLGMATTTEDVLVIYGYQDSTELRLYYGGQLGCEWLQVNPHYALAVHAGLRNYLGLARELSSDAPLVLSAAAAIKYTF